MLLAWDAGGKSIKSSFNFVKIYKNYGVMAILCWN